MTASRILSKENDRTDEEVLLNPRPDDLVRAHNLGKKSREIHIYVICAECGEMRWTATRQDGKYPNCRPCTDRITGNQAHGVQRRRWGPKKYTDIMRVDGRTDAETVLNPHEGDIVNGHALGHDGRRYTYTACIDCGVLRWNSRSRKYPRCNPCAQQRANHSGDRHSKKGDRYDAVSADILANPKAGDLLPGRYLGKEHGLSTYYAAHVYVVCVNCGDGRWVSSLHKTPSPFCQQCRIGPNNIHWKGGIHVRQGYRIVAIRNDSPYFAMAYGENKPRIGWGYVLEHRLVMAKHLGRCLEPWEIVHHKDADRLNNDISNLELTNADLHLTYTRMQAQIDKLAEEVALLKKTVKLQSWHIQEMEKNPDVIQ